MTFSNFLNDESGAVTVDWVVLTAAIVGIAIAVLTLIAGGISTSTQSTNTQVAATDSVAGLIGGETEVENTEIASNAFGIPDTWELMFEGDEDEHSGSGIVYYTDASTGDNMTVHYDNGYVYNDSDSDAYYSGVTSGDGTITMYETPSDTPQ